MRVKQSLSLQEDACHCKESVCDTADGASVRVPASTQCGVASAAPVIVLSGNACPMIDSVAQSNVRGVAHDYDMRLDRLGSCDPRSSSDRRGYGPDPGLVTAFGRQGRTLTQA